MTIDLDDKVNALLAEIEAKPANINRSTSLAADIRRNLTKIEKIIANYKRDNQPRIYELLAERLFGNTIKPRALQSYIWRARKHAKGGKLTQKKYPKKDNASDPQTDVKATAPTPTKRVAAHPDPEVATPSQVSQPDSDHGSAATKSLPATANLGTETTPTTPKRSGKLEPVFTPIKVSDEGWF